MVCAFQGMAHRDLKPENILCEFEDKVSLSIILSFYLELGDKRLHVGDMNFIHCL